MKAVIGVAVAALALGAAATARADASAPPVNVSPPTILGDAALGNTLTTDGGTWNSATVFLRTYVWQACDPSGANCSVIRDETGAAYVPKYFQVKPGSTVRVAVTAWNVGGTAVSTSAPVTIRGTAAVMLAAPQVSGDPHVGGSLTVSDGTWTSVEPWSITETWLRCWPDQPSSCTPIPSFGPTLLVSGLDAGWLVRAQVTLTTPSGATAVVTDPIAIPGPAPLRLVVDDTDLGTLVVGRQYDLPLWSGGAPPYGFTTFGGPPPVGMSVTPSGHLVGRPARAQNTEFGGDVTDAAGKVARGLRFRFKVVPAYMASHGLTAFAVDVVAAPPATGPCASAGTTASQVPQLLGEVDGWDLQVGQPASLLLAEFGELPYTFCVLAGALPPGLTLDPATGWLRGTPTRPGGYTVDLAVADVAGAAGAFSRTIGFVVAPRPAPKRKPHPHTHRRVP